MAFQCTACSVKSYDKHWKLQRHQRESSSCFKHFFPEKPLPTRFKCPECNRYGSVREKDVKRHLRVIHHMDPETSESSGLEFTRPTNTLSQGFTSTQVDTTTAPDFQQIAGSSAHQDQVLESTMKPARPNEIKHPASGPSTASMTFRTLCPTPFQRAKPHIIQEGSGEIKLVDSCCTPPSHPPTIKRKYSDPCSLPKQCKRLHKRVNLEDPSITDGVYGTHLDDTFTVANYIRRQGIDTDVVDQNASEPFSRASGLRPRPHSRNQSGSRFGTIAIPTMTTASHDTPSTEDSRAIIFKELELHEARWRVWL
jgi:hypothetical protein